MQHQVLTKKVTVSSKLGLHLRPACSIVQEASRYCSSISLCSKGYEVDAKSVTDILLLTAGHGSMLELRIKGEDAHDAMKSLVPLIEKYDI